MKPSIVVLSRIGGSRTAFYGTAYYSFVLAVALSLALLGAYQPARGGAPNAPDALVHEGVVAASSDKVWAAFTTKQGQESWMVAHSDIELKVGGRMRTHYDPQGVIGDAKTIHNTILSFDPQRMLSMQVSQAPEGFAFGQEIKAMWTVIYFEPVGADATRVRIVSQGFTDSENSQKMRSFFDRGNGYTLQKLQERFAPKAPAQEPKQ